MDHGKNSGSRRGTKRPCGSLRGSLGEVQLIGGTRAVVLQHDECVVGLAGFLGVDTAGVGASLRQERGSHLLCQADLLGGKEAVVPPQPELAAPSLAEIAVFALRDLCAAAGAFAHNGSAGGEQHPRAVHRRSVPNKTGNHFLNAGEELVRAQLAAFDLLEAVLPFGGEQRGLELFGQHGNEGHARFGGNEAYRLFRLFALRKARGHQLFNDRRPGRGSSQPAPLRSSSFGAVAKSSHICSSLFLF